MLDILRIIEENSIKVFYQVIISPIDTLSFSVESFIRGIHPETNELIAPYLLFSEAQAQGLSKELEEAAIFQTLLTFKNISVLNQRLMLHMNISNSFIFIANRDNFIIECAKELGIDSHRIVLDINSLQLDEESIQLVTSFINQHRRAGFYISIDDIGKNYHNIDKILVFNPDIIKINHQMLTKLENEHYKKSLIQHITTLAHDMCIQVISTGIESKEHLIDAVKSGAQLLQGFYLSPTDDLSYDNIIEIINQFDRELVFQLVNAEKTTNIKSVIGNVVTFNSSLRKKIFTSDFEDTKFSLNQIMSTYTFIESGYMLDMNGVQISDSFLNKESFGSRNKELFGLYNKGFNHSDEESFYRLQIPMLTDWVINPFRSRLTNEICVTGSLKFKGKNDTFILVLNIDYIKFESFLNRKEQEETLNLTF